MWFRDIRGSRSNSRAATHDDPRRCANVKSLRHMQPWPKNFFWHCRVQKWNLWLTWLTFAVCFAALFSYQNLTGQATAVRCPDRKLRRSILYIGCLLEMIFLHIFQMKSAEIEAEHGLLSHLDKWNTGRVVMLDMFEQHQGTLWLATHSLEMYYQHAAGCWVQICWCLMCIFKYCKASGCMYRVDRISS